MENQINVEDKQQVIADIIAKKDVFMYSILRKPGLKIYKLNMKTGIISELEKVKNVQVTPDGARGEVKETEFHLHTQALNIKNAKKQFEKKLDESRL